MAILKPSIHQYSVILKNLILLGFVAICSKYGYCQQKIDKMSDYIKYRILNHEVPTTECNPRYTLLHRFSRKSSKCFLNEHIVYLKEMCTLWYLPNALLLKEQNANYLGRLQLNSDYPKQYEMTFFFIFIFHYT